MLMALAFPSAGLSRGLDVIKQFAISGKIPLEVACKAGALCVISRVSLEEEFELYENRLLQQGLDEIVSDVGVPASHLERHDANVSGPSKLSDSKVHRPSISESANEQEAEADAEQQPSIRLALRDFPSKVRFLPAIYWYSWTGRNVHGSCNLPPGHTIEMLPHDFPISSVIENFTKAAPQSPTNRSIRSRYTTYFVDGISMANSLARAVIAVFQTLYASFALYETWGDQIDRYEYAAFGLTVTPYLIIP
jgi:hypothetical protein